MSDCANVEMRELLPELVAGTVDASTRARVDEHVSACADCAAELETLRLVRSAFLNAPAVDVGRIVAALPKPTARQPAVHPTRPVKRWLDWRIAAALTTITVGGLSLAVSQRTPTSLDTVRRDSIEVASNAPIGPNESARDSVPDARLARDPRSQTSQQKEPVVGGTTQRTETASKAQLSFGGGTGDLDDASLQALLGALEEIDRAPVAPSAEPDRTPVLPVIREGDR
jgi:hypothetical protein